MSKDKVIHLVNSKDITVRSVIADLCNIEEQIDEIYVVVKTKEGQWAPSLAGDLGGLAFAILFLQDQWNKVYE